MKINKLPPNNPISNDKDTPKDSSAKTTQGIEILDRMPTVTATNPSQSSKTYTFSNISAFFTSLPRRIYHWFVKEILGHKTDDVRSTTINVKNYAALARKDDASSSTNGATGDRTSEITVPSYETVGEKTKKISKADPQKLSPGAEEHIKALSRKIESLDKGNLSKEAKTSIAVLHFAQDLFTCLAPKEQVNPERILGIATNPLSVTDPIVSLANEFSTLEGVSWTSVLETIEKMRQSGDCFPNTRQITDETKFDLTLKVLKSLQESAPVNEEKIQSVVQSIISQRTFLNKPAIAFPLLFNNFPRDQQKNAIEHLLQNSREIPKDTKKMFTSFSKEDTSFLLSVLYDMQGKVYTPLRDSLLLRGTERLIALDLEEGSLPSVLANDSTEQSQFLHYIAKNPDIETEPLSNFLRNQFSKASLTKELKTALFSLIIKIEKLTQKDTATEVFSNLTQPIEDRLREQVKQEILTKLSRKPKSDISTEETSTFSEVSKISQEISKRIDTLLKQLDMPLTETIDPKDLKPAIQAETVKLTSQIAKINQDIDKNKEEITTLEEVIQATKQALPTSSIIPSGWFESSETKEKKKVLAGFQEQVENFKAKNAQLEKEITEPTLRREELRSIIEEIDNRSYSLNSVTDPIVKESLSAIIEKKQKKNALEKAMSDKDLDTIIHRAINQEVSPQVPLELENTLISQEWQKAARQALDNKDASDYLEYIEEMHPEVSKRPENTQLGVALGLIKRSFTIDETAESHKVQEYLQTTKRKFLEVFFNSPTKYTKVSSSTQTDILVKRLVQNKLLWSKLLPSVKNMVLGSEIAPTITKEKKEQFLTTLNKKMLDYVNTSLSSPTTPLETEDREFLEKLSYDIQHNVLLKEAA